MPDELSEDERPLSAEDILDFGPVVESAVWNLAWIAEAKAPIAVAAGKPKFGKVFDERGMGKAVLIRPCISRGRRIRGLSPIYTPTMLEANSQVWAGWPMYLDHVPAELAAAVAKRGRSVKEMGGQVVTPSWAKDFVAEYDGEFGYQPGATVAEIWANEFVQKLVGENPNALHTSVAAWPKSGKPGPVPWMPQTKGMVIEGIRRQPAGSVDFVPRGGAGGRLLLAEGEQVGEGAWPEPQWDPEVLKLAIQIAESLPEKDPEVSPADRTYASAAMSKLITKPLAEMSEEELRAHLQENAPHLAGVLREGETTQTRSAPAAAGPSITQADVAEMVKSQVAEATADIPSKEELEQSLREEFEERDKEREEQRGLAEAARLLISQAKGVPETWKKDLTARYAMRPEGAPPALLVEAVSAEDAEDGKSRTKLQVLTEDVIAALDHSRELIAEATGKPRVTQEGGAQRSTTTDRGVQTKKTSKAVPLWRQTFAEMGIVEADNPLAIHGVEKVEG